MLHRLCFAVLMLFAALPAQADELRPGYLELTQLDTQQWKLVWKAPVLGGLATRTRPAFPEFCSQSPPQARVEGAVLVAESRLTCTKDLAGAQVGLAGMDAAFTDALLRVAPLGRPIQTTRVSGWRGGLAKARDAAGPPWRSVSHTPVCPTLREPPRALRAAAQVLGIR